MELYQAHQQWATRPQDERFHTLEDMYAATKGYADRAAEAEVAFSALRVEAGSRVGDTTGPSTELRLVGKTGVPAILTNYAFKQLAARISAPSSYLASLPATLAAQNLNYGLVSANDDRKAKLLFHQNGDLMLRAATSEAYERVWNYEVIERLIALSQKHGLVPARPTFRQFDDGKGSGPALYASDHDMFAFLMTPDRALIDPTKQPLYRGIITVNSEVGAAALKVLGFLFREICGNHIIWGAEEIAEVRLVHRSGIRKGMIDAEVAVRRYFDGAASIDEAKFAETTVQVAGTKEEVLDKVFGKVRGNITRKALESGYDATVPDEDGDPRTLWGLAQGITRHSQTIPFADERTALDRAAGKVLQIAF